MILTLTMTPTLPQTLKNLIYCLSLILKFQSNLSQSNLSLSESKLKPISKNSLTKSCLNAKTVSSKPKSNSNKSNTICDNTGIIEGNIEDFKYLIGKIHKDNEDFQRYITDKVFVDRESRNIVGERILILKDGRRNRSRDPHPIHIRDIEEMTNQYEQESSRLLHRALKTYWRRL